MGTKRYRDLGIPLYHISFDSQLPSVLKPQLPAGGEDPDATGADAPKWPYPEPSVPRVSFSSTLVGALRAVYPNWVKLLEESHTVTFWVYRAVDCDNCPFYTPETIAKKHWVHDALVTQEYFTTKSVSVERIGQFVATIDPDSKQLEYQVFGTGDTHTHSPEVITVGPLSSVDTKGHSVPSSETTFNVIDDYDVGLMLVASELPGVTGITVLSSKPVPDLTLEWLKTQFGEVKVIGEERLLSVIADSGHVILLTETFESIEHTLNQFDIQVNRYD